MAENTKIEWADHTVNFWWGCTKISPACLNCYAEAQDRHFHPSIPTGIRFQGEPSAASHWGLNAPRMVRTMRAWGEAQRYERLAVKDGRRLKVFTNSMADFFEDRKDLDLPRMDALDTIRCTPHLDWMILTKRPERILDLLRRVLALDPIPALAGWLRSWIGGAPPANVWVGATVEDQARAQLRIPALLAVPARVRFLSCEPLLGSLDLMLLDCWLGFTPTRDLLHWVICGGESGPHARPMHPEWVRSVRNQCAMAGVPFLFKQWGEWMPVWDRDEEDPDLKLCSDLPREDKRGRWMNLAGGHGFHGERVYWVSRVGKKVSGRFLDGKLHDGYPEVAHAQD